MRLQCTSEPKPAWPPPPSPAPRDLGLSVIIAAYPGITTDGGTGEGVPRGPRPRPARLESRREGPRAVTGRPAAGGGGARRLPRGQVHMVPPPAPPDIGQLTDIGARASGPAAPPG